MAGGSWGGRRPPSPSSVPEASRPPASPLDRPPDIPSGARPSLQTGRIAGPPAAPPSPPGAGSPQSSRGRQPTIHTRNRGRRRGVGIAAAALSLLVLGSVGWRVVGSDDQSSTEGLVAPVSSSESVGGVGSTATTDASRAGSIDPSQVDWDMVARSVVYIEALSPCDWRGSGTIVLDGSYILTNEHVSSDGRCELRIGMTAGLSIVPDPTVRAIVMVSDAEVDLAVLRMVDAAGAPLRVSGFVPVTIDASPVRLGDVISTIGYPALGGPEQGLTVTFTRGAFAGMEYDGGEFYKTDAQMRGGVSGGGAFNALGKLIGVPTAGLVDVDTGELVGINLIRPIKYAVKMLEAASSASGARVGSADGSSSGDVDTDAELGSSDADDPWFGSCGEAKSHGYGPYFEGGDPEYDWYVDRDNDGVVCE